MFRDARWKIERADKHIADLEAAVRALPERYRSFIEADTQGRGHSIVYKLPNVDQVRSELALMTGDAIHNLNASLDFAWHAILLKLAPGLVNGRTKFPFRETVEDLQGILKKQKIDITIPALFELVVSNAQPYSAGKHSLWPLYKLGNIDKHRLLLPVAQYCSIRGIVVQDKTGNKTAGDTWGLPGFGPFHIDIPNTHDIQDAGEFSLKILFDEGTTLKGREVADSPWFSKVCLYIVQLVEHVAIA